MGCIMEYVNKDLCKKCDGYCCKKSGCDYGVDNFDIVTLNKVLEVLNSGKASIVAALFFKTNSSSAEYISPFLYLRARNTNRDKVDLLSMKTTCSLLKSDGCSLTLEERPKGGVNLIPDSIECYPLEDPFKIVDEWKKYQHILAKAVRKLTGKSVNEKLSEDIENLVYDVQMQHFDHVAVRERIEILSLIKELVRVCPEECSRGLQRAKKDKLVITKR